MDVERADLPPPMSLFRSLLAAVQCCDPVSASRTRGLQGVAGIYVGTDIPSPVPGELSHHVKSCPPQNPEKQREGTKRSLRRSLRSSSDYQVASKKGAKRDKTQTQSEESLTNVGPSIETLQGLMCLWPRWHASSNNN